MKPEDKPDPHLGQALAHAPDRDVQPPAHLSAQILAAAHREAADSPRRERPTALPWWRRPWGASGALATVLMAGFLGLLWRGEPPGPAVDEPPPAAPAQATVQTAQADVQPAVQAQALPQAHQETAQVQAEQKVARQRQAAASARAERPVQAVAAAPAAPLGKVAADQVAAAEPAKEVAAAPAVVAAPPSPPAPAPVLLPAPAPARTAAFRAAAPAAALSATAVPTLPAWEAGDQLQWGATPSQTVPDAGWLQQLSVLTQGRWAPASAAPSAPLQLSWQRGGAPLGALHWSAGEVWWCAAGQACLRAEVPEQAWSSLLKQLASGR